MSTRIVQRLGGFLVLVFLANCSCGPPPGADWRRQRLMEVGVPFHRADPDWCEILPGRSFELCLRTSPWQTGRASSEGQLVVCLEDQIEATIQRLNDLAPYVQLDSEEKALYFLRLRSHLLTRRTSFGPWIGWEIGADGTVGPGPGVGRIDPALLPPGCKGTVITKSGDQWHVTRYIAVPSKTQPGIFDEIVKLSEKVYRVGYGYHEEVRRETVYSGDLGIKKN